VDQFMAGIKKVGVNLRDITYIILSHGHLDHGGAARLQDATEPRGTPTNSRRSKKSKSICKSTAGAGRWVSRWRRARARGIVEGTKVRRSPSVC
jgi:metal-dependent hydrolase (beta-lactamase superfamily II)